MRTSWKQILAFIVVVGGVNFLIDQLVVEENHPHKFLEMYRAWMVKSKPDVVLVGNSMLGAGVDTRTVSLITGKKVLKLAQGGTASAAWYLMIKNVALAFPDKPEAVVLFFRDFFLTQPGFRVTKYHRRFIEDISDGPETLVSELAFGKEIGVGTYLNQYCPAYRHQEILEKKLSDLAKAISGRLGNSDHEEPAVKRAGDSLKSVFSEKNMDVKIATKEQQEAETVRKTDWRSFHEALDVSFLPHIISMTKSQGVPLILVRIKRRSLAMNKPESESLKGYIRDLKAYLEENSVPLIDFSYDERISLEHYAAGDHLNTHTGRKHFSKLLGKRLLGYLK